ncbi:MAG: hypothetical protein JW924_03400 [Fusobacteriaceae bacterium]|nr:hypothetical protein [Fusobacteriaceae bacterium]
MKVNIKLNAVNYDEFTVNDVDGNLITGLTSGDFTVKLYNPSGSEVSGSISITITELGYGLYRTNFTPNALGNWTLLITNTTYFPYGKSSNYACVQYLNDDIGLIVELLKQYQGGRWRINTAENKMYFYKEDNVTVIAVFDLKDADGNPSVTDVFERRRNT